MKQSALGFIGEARLRAGSGKGLAGKSTGEYGVVAWKGGQRFDVFVEQRWCEIGTVGSGCLTFYFTAADTVTSQIFQSLEEATDASKEFSRSRLGSTRRECGRPW